MFMYSLTNQAAQNTEIFPEVIPRTMPHLVLLRRHADTEQADVNIRVHGRREKCVKFLPNASNN